jgi:signal transduction histidine kinase
MNEVATPEFEVATLRRKLVARDKTIAALIGRVEGSTRTDSAFACFESNLMLERAVAQKTRELTESHARLGEAHAELQRTQARLLQATNLEAIGRLAAGIAHEINTPVQFVGDSIHFIGEAAGEMAALVETYRGLLEAMAANEDPGAVRQRAAAADEAADLEYLREQLPKALARTTEGIARVATIVRSLRDFAHPGRTEMTLVDINRAVETTLVVAKGEYKYVAEVAVDLGELPLVTCHGGEINQVILNVLVNAAHAVADARKADGSLGRIVLRTRAVGERVLISIADDGCGIPDEIRDRIFDPFFTTKEVGRGTGQGLAIARAVVVEHHRGEILVDSTPGKGTTLSIYLPIQRASVPPQPASAGGVAVSGDG